MATRRLTEAGLRQMIKRIIAESGDRRLAESLVMWPHYRIWSQELADAYGPDYLNWSSDLYSAFPELEGYDVWSQDLAAAYGDNYLNYSDLAKDHRAAVVDRDRPDYPERGFPGENMNLRPPSKFPRR
jgi:hypothetical protein